jgi:hypothetical protein
MAATIKFFANGNRIDNDAGSGLAFMGANWGTSLLVGAYNARTFIASSDGTSQGAEANNNQFVSSTGCVIGQSGSGIALTQVPNAQATLNIRFEYDSPVQVPTATLYAYDRTSIQNGPSGLLVKAFEAIHPNPAQVAGGSGDSVWTSIAGSGSTLSLAPSPGSGGLYAGNGSNSTKQDAQHDYYVGISVSPTTVGSKLGALYISAEYL